MLKHALAATVTAALLLPAAAQASTADAGPGPGPAAQAAAAAKGKKKPKKPKQLSVSAAADPLAPAGKTPKVLFTVHHPAKGAGYRISAKQVRGESEFAPGNDDTPRCVKYLGSTILTKAPSTADLPMPRFPFDVEESNNGYDLIGGQPCKGVYEGELDERGGPGRSVYFVFTIPGYDLDVTGRYPR